MSVVGEECGSRGGEGREERGERFGCWKYKWLMEGGRKMFKVLSVHCCNSNLKSLEGLDHIRQYSRQLFDPIYSIYCPP